MHTGQGMDLWEPQRTPCQSLPCLPVLLSPPRLTSGTSYNSLLGILLGTSEHRAGLENPGRAEAHELDPQEGGHQCPDPKSALGLVPDPAAGSLARWHLPPSSFSLARMRWGRGFRPFALILDCETAQCPRL